MKTILLFLLTLIYSLNVNAQMKTAFINGDIHTVDVKNPEAEAVVIQDNKIIFVGSNDDAKKIMDDKTKVIDLKGKLMLPGFIDSHLHFVSGGYYLLGINLRPAKSLDKFKTILKNYVDERPGKWVTGGRWDHEGWDSIAPPTRYDVDEFTKETPVMVSRIDGHMGLANSYALKLAGITKDTPDPDGGLIERDPETGEPTGILKDAAMDLVFDVIPEESTEDNIEAIQRAMEEANRLGITSIHDITETDQVEAFNILKENDELTTRIYSIYPMEHFDELVEKDITVNTGSDFFRRGALKEFSDGSLGAKTAWFFEKYVQDTTTFGLPMKIVTDGSLKKWSLEADKEQLQICVHAIGDKANNYLLNLFEEVKNENPVWDRRFRIEHAQHLKEADIKRFNEIGVIASVQPYHAIDDGVWAEKRIGKERLKTTHAYKSLLDNDAVVAFGTDWPVAPLNPLLGIYAAVTRATKDGKNPNGWIPEQKISVEEAVRCYTLNAAYASFEEDKKGSIEVGKLADLVVLNEDILSIDPEKIKDAEVVMTIVDGKIVYEK